MSKICIGKIIHSKDGSYYFATPFYLHNHNKKFLERVQHEIENSPHTLQSLINIKKKYSKIRIVDLYMTKAGKYNKLMYGGILLKMGKQEELEKIIKKYQSMNTFHEKQEYLEELWENHLNKTKTTTSEKGIYKIGERYNILFSHNGKTRYYGSFKKLSDAIKQKNNIIQQGFPEYQTKYQEKHNYPKYLKKNKSGSWVITYNGEYYGSFKCIEDAIRERDFLISIDWDYDLIDCY